MAETWSGEFYCVKCKEKREADGEVQGERQGHPDGQGCLPRLRHQPQPHPRQGLSPHPQHRRHDGGIPTRVPPSFCVRAHLWSAVRGPRRLRLASGHALDLRPRTPRRAPRPRHLQVGLYDDRRVVLARTATTDAVIARDPRAPAPGHRPARCRRHGGSTGAERLCRAARRHSRGGPTVVRRGAWACSDGWGPTRHLSSDRAGLVRIGLRSAPRPTSCSCCRAGELDRERLDALVRSETPHLVVRAVDGGVRRGPLRGPWAHRVPALPRRPPEPSATPIPGRALTRYIEATRTPRGDGRPDARRPRAGPAGPRLGRARPASPT